MAAPGAKRRERCQPGAAKAHLEKLIGGKTFSCEPEGLPSDFGGEWVGICVVSEQPCWLAVPCAEDPTLWLNRLQVAAGHARDREGEFSVDEDQAKKRRRGMWSGTAD